MDPNPEPDPLVRDADPDPYQNVRDPQHCRFIIFQVQVVILEDPDGHEICFVGE